MNTSVIVLAFFSAFVTSLAMAESPEPVEVTYDDGKYLIQLERALDAPINSVFSVLTDYEHLTRLDPHIQESELISRSDSEARVYTSVRGCVVLFCRTINRTHDMTEVSPSRISAKLIVAESNVFNDQFTWTLISQGDATRVIYTQEIEPGFWVPPLIGPAILKRSLGRAAENAMDNLERIAREQSE